MSEVENPSKRKKVVENEIDPDRFTVVNKIREQSVDQKKLRNLLDALPHTQWDTFRSWRNLGTLIYDYYEGDEEKALSVWVLYTMDTDQWKCTHNICYMEMDSFENKGRAFALKKLSRKIWKYNPTAFVRLRRSGNIDIHSHDYDNIPSEISTEDDFCWFNFYTKYQSHHFASENDMIMELREQLPRVLVWYESERRYIKKVDCDTNSMVRCKKNDNFDGLWFTCTITTTSDYTSISSDVKITISQFLQHYWEFKPCER